MNWFDFHTSGGIVESHGHLLGRKPNQGEAKKAAFHPCSRILVPLLPKRQFRHYALGNGSLPQITMIGDQTLASGNTLEQTGLAHQEFWLEQHLIMCMALGMLCFF